MSIHIGVLTITLRVQTAQRRYYELATSCTWADDPTSNILSSLIGANLVYADLIVSSPKHETLNPKPILQVVTQSHGPPRSCFRGPASTTPALGKLRRDSTVSRPLLKTLGFSYFIVFGVGV